MKKSLKIGANCAVAATIFIAGCASAPAAPDVLATLKASFAERGIAKLDRLEQTELQRLCSEAAAQGKALAPEVRDRLQNTIYQSIPYPADGKFLGDWREGEKIAQSGRGLQFSDQPGAPNGANCYACHQITPQEISFGNQGPSLLHYARNRAVKDPNAPQSQAIVRYTWARIWNTHAFNACSGMPRFGDAGILTQDQIRDVMALLLDPNSPVNR